MKVLLIDDFRDVTLEMVRDADAAKEAVVARDYRQGIIFLVSSKWDLLLLDHDLSSYVDGKEKTGYDIMCFLERNPEYLPGKIKLVTSNPVGRYNMQMVIDRLYAEEK